MEIKELLAKKQEVDNQIAELRAALGDAVDVKLETVGTSLPFSVGQKIFARTVTYHVTGEIVAITGKWLTLEKAAWIADSGRFSDALKTSEFDEVEPFTDTVYLNTDSITDATIIKSLPDKQK